MTDLSQITVASRTPTSSLAYALLTGEAHPRLFEVCQGDWLCETLWHLLIADDHLAFSNCLSATLESSLLYCAFQPPPDAQPSSMPGVESGGALLPMASVSVLGASIQSFSPEVLSVFSDFSPQRLVRGMDIATLLDLGWARDWDGKTFAETDHLSELLARWSADEHVVPLYERIGPDGTSLDLAPAAVGAALVALGLPIESARWHYFTWGSQSIRPMERLPFQAVFDSPAIADAIALSSLWTSNHVNSEVWLACGRREILALGAYLKTGSVPPYCSDGGPSYPVQQDAEVYAHRCEFWRIPSWAPYSSKDWEQ